MLKIARRTISSIAAQIDDDGNEDFREQSSDAQLSPKAIEARERKELEDQIVDKWSTVWFGLYQVRERHGPFHIENLEKLYLGAGMAGHLTKNAINNDRRRSSPPFLGLLGPALSTYSHRYYNSGGSDGSAGGIEDLRLFDNQSTGTLRSTLDLLAAYEKEIGPLQELYALLRSLQVDLSRTPNEEDVQEILNRYPPIADPIAERILHYNSRLAVLVMDAETEAMETYRQADIPVDDLGVPLKKNRPVAWYVKDRVFPRGKRSGVISGSGVFSGSGF